MTETNPFDVLARYYDWEHAAFADDVAMYSGFVKRTGGPVLELACGTGRLLLPLAAEGARLVGVDSSAEMLAIARQGLDRAGLGGTVRLHLGDMRDFVLEERFRLAFVALDSFGLLRRRPDQLAALRRAHDHLDPGGLLVLDVANGNLRGGEARDEVLLQHVGIDPTSGRPLSKWTARSTDLAAQVDHFTYLYDELRDDGTVERRTAGLALRYFGRFELELLLERGGFAVEALYGSYDLAPFEPESERLIAVAVKAPPR
jgi:SAM-dependent methyltransferase